MGYRIDITAENGLNYYGTKHYGYSFEFGYRHDKECLNYPSYRYLKYLKKVDGYECWNYGFYGKIDLTARQFNHFIKLYAKEWDEIKGIYRDWGERSLLNEPEIQDLMKDKGMKHIEWF